MKVVGGEAVDLSGLYHLRHYRIFTVNAMGG